MANKPPVKLLSCDTHLEHWPTVLQDYVPSKFHELMEEAPYAFGRGPVSANGPQGITLNALSGYGKYSEVRPGSIDLRTQKIPGAYGGAREYLGWMDIDGVAASVLLPGVAMGAAVGAVKGTKDRDGYIAFVQGYNNWVSDLCSECPDRLLGGAMIPQSSIDDAIAELRRVRKLPAMRTISPGAFPNASNAPAPEDDRFWAECLELAMPITFHGGISSPRAGFESKTDVAAWIIGHLEVTTGGPFSATQLILSGVFDRFPQLRIIIQECGAGWLPFSMDVMNHMYDRQRFWAGIDLKNPPAWYCTSGNLLWNILADHVAIKLVDDIGVDNLSWSSDFPHGNSNYPFSRERALELTAPLSDEDRHKVLWGNAAKFYGVEAKTAAKPAAKQSVPA